MSNTQTLAVLLLVFYAVPLVVAAMRRGWLKFYFASVFAGALLLGYQTWADLQAEEDCRAGCAIVISITILIIATAMTGSLLAILSVSGFRKWRSVRAARSRERASQKAIGAK
ncbi:hypothetical protein JM946_01700 [Steroidobacter sp. S1-65]|uniref:Uncharacterized protein n=1 Tax=Steroidobacter gossypii TaxID=2805490 RepID=A0ABS1WR48_9GAMM|nr:hypothetical protein [Steroidobacter gossypii]MBM0103433.1 hypothetical protein [Steroidobacter gossypii]